MRVAALAALILASLLHAPLSAQAHNPPPPDGSGFWYGTDFKPALTGVRAVAEMEHYNYWWCKPGHDLKNYESRTYRDRHRRVLREMGANQDAPGFCLWQPDRDYVRFSRGELAQSTCAVGIAVHTVVLAKEDAAAAYMARQTEADHKGWSCGHYSEHDEASGVGDPQWFYDRAEHWNGPDSTHMRKARVAGTEIRHVCSLAYGYPQPAKSSVIDKSHRYNEHLTGHPYHESYSHLGHSGQRTDEPMCGRWPIPAPGGVKLVCESSGGRWQTRLTWNKVNTWPPVDSYWASYASTHDPSGSRTRWGNNARAGGGSDTEHRVSARGGYKYWAQVRAQGPSSGPYPKPPYSNRRGFSDWSDTVTATCEPPTPPAPTMTCVEGSGKWTMRMTWPPVDGVEY